MPTDPRIAILSALSSPGWHPVPEAHGMPWDEAEQLLAAYDASRAAAASAVPSAPADRAAILLWAAERFDARAAAIADVSDNPAIFVAKDRAKVAGVWTEGAAELRRLAGEAQQPAPLRAELKPWQLLGDVPDEPLPQTERLVGGRRLTRDEAQQADGPPAPLRRAWDDCPGFPEQCPNLRPVDPAPPTHLGGIRCGCADKETARG